MPGGTVNRIVGDSPAEACSDRRAPTAFIDLLEGRNFGKVVVRVTDISSETN